jgi:hypothetical protein
MLASSTPTRFGLAFGANAGSGYIRTIPNTTGTAGAASYNTGFPPVCFTDPSAGGIPWSGQDVNGILNAVTRASQWIQAGGLPTYDSTFSTAISGYPNGAVLLKANGTGFWRSSVDNNSTNPDTGGANWTSFNPSGSYSAYNDLSGANVLTSAYGGTLNDVTTANAQTLPAANSVSRGVAITFTFTAAGSVQRAGSDTMTINGTPSLTSKTGAIGAWMQCVSDGTSVWTCNYLTAGLGNGQSFHQGTAATTSPAFGTVYQNTSNQTIFVMITASSGSAFTLDFFADASSSAVSSATFSAPAVPPVLGRVGSYNSNTNPGIFIPVPAGYYYKAVCSVSPTLNGWTELR